MVVIELVLTVIKLRYIAIETVLSVAITFLLSPIKRCYYVSSYYDDKTTEGSCAMVKIIICNDR